MEVRTAIVEHETEWPWTLTDGVVKVYRGREILCSFRPTQQQLAYMIKRCAEELAHQAVS